MKITIIGVKQGTIGGGVEKINIEFIEYLKKENIIEKIGILKDPNERFNDWITLADKKYLHVRKLSQTFKLLLNLKNIYSLKNKRKLNSLTEDSDVLIITDPYAIPLVSKSSNTRVIFQLHASIIEKNMYSYMVKLYLKLYRKKIDKLLYLDKRDEELLSKYNIKMNLIHNFGQVSRNVDVVDFSQRNGKIVYFGILQKFKRIEKIAKWATENKVYADFYGERKDYTETELENLKSEYVNIFDQRYNKEDIEKKFKFYNAFIMDSIVEGQPLAIYEANAIGLPIIIGKNLIQVDYMLNNNGIDIKDEETINKILTDEISFNKILTKQSELLKNITIESYFEETFR